MTLILFILDFKNRKHVKIQFNRSSFQDINLKLILMCKFQNVPCVLGFEEFIIDKWQEFN